MAKHTRTIKIAQEQWNLKIYIKEIIEEITSNCLAILRN